MSSLTIGPSNPRLLQKLKGLDGPAAVRRNLLAMLAKTQDLEAKESENTDFVESAEPFICVLARLYCRRLLEAVRFGLRQEYVAHEELLTFYLTGPTSPTCGNTNGLAAGLPGLRGIRIRCCRRRPDRLREPGLQLLQLTEHDLGVVAALPKKVVSLPVEFIAYRISVHVGLQEALRACRRTAWGSRVARRGGPPAGGVRRSRQLEDGNAGKEGHAPRNRFGVAPTGLLDDERRHEQLEVALPGPPPATRPRRTAFPGRGQRGVGPRRAMA